MMVMVKLIFGSPSFCLPGMIDVHHRDNSKILMNRCFSSSKLRIHRGPCFIWLSYLILFATLMHHFFRCMHISTLFATWSYNWVSFLYRLIFPFTFSITLSPIDRCCLSARAYIFEYDWLVFHRSGYIFIDELNCFIIFKILDYYSAPLVRILLLCVKLYLLICTSIIFKVDFSQNLTFLLLFMSIILFYVRGCRIENWSMKVLTFKFYS